MNDANRLFAEMTNDVLSAFGGVQAISYSFGNSIISTTGAIFQEMDYLGDQQQVSEPRWVLALSKQHVNNPKKGSLIRDAKSVDWILDERLAQDEWIDIWAIQAK